MPKILMIGGCGYVGSFLYQHLTSKGMSVDTVDLEWFGNQINPNNLCMDYCCLDSKQLKRYDVVILLAAHAGVAMCKDDRGSSFRNNVVNFVELLDKLDGQKLIYASSSSIYGDTCDVVAPEDWERYDPKTFYDLNKQEIDYYAQLSDVEAYGLRFGTVNGWSPNLRIDIMLNKMYQCALEDNKIFVFNKNIYRPILGILDLARGVEAIIRGGDHRGIYNMASFNASVEEIANSINCVLGGDVEIVDKGESDTYNFSISTQKFQDVYDFEFKASVGTIVQSLKEQWELANKTVRERKEYVQTCD